MRKAIICKFRGVFRYFYTDQCIYLDFVLGAASIAKWAWMARNFLITRTTESGKYLDMSLTFPAIAKDKKSFLRASLERILSSPE